MEQKSCGHTKEFEQLQKVKQLNWKKCLKYLFQNTNASTHCLLYYHGQVRHWSNFTKASFILTHKYRRNNPCLWRSSLTLLKLQNNYDYKRAHLHSHGENCAVYRTSTKGIFREFHDKTIIWSTGIYIFMYTSGRGNMFSIINVILSHI